jgi:hypothetical protein
MSALISIALVEKEHSPLAKRTDLLAAWALAQQAEHIGDFVHRYSCDTDN